LSGSKQFVIKIGEHNIAQSSTKLLSIALMVIGLGLAVWGFMTADSFGSQLSSAISGSPTDRVMMLYIGGAASFAAGIFLFLKKK